jgi:tetratricopeptide (TPR) repeat protein
MPRDWDLYALLGPPLLLAMAAMLTHSRDQIPIGPVCGAVLAFGVFTCAGAALNASPARLSVRLEGVGEYVFRTYYAGSSNIINVAQAMEADTTRQIARREASIARLRPVGAGDVEYTHLLVRVVALYKARGDDAASVRWMERAMRIDPGNEDLALQLADGYLMLGDPERAKSLANAILIRDPNHFDALVIRAIAAAQERNFDEARACLERARWLRPDDPGVRSLIDDLDRQTGSASRGGR